MFLSQKLKMWQVSPVPSEIVTDSITQVWLHQILIGAFKNRYRFRGPTPGIRMENLQELSPGICTFRCFPGHADAQKDSESWRMNLKTQEASLLVSDKGNVGSTLFSKGRSVREVVTSKALVLNCY